MKQQWTNKFRDFSPAGIRRMALLALASFAGGLFIKLTWELKEDPDLNHLDEAVLIFIGKLRLTALNRPLVDVTAVGSATVSFLICLIGIVVLWFARDRLGAIFLLLSVAGAGMWSTIIKLLVQRERPTIISHLVEVADFSYPSGHTIVSTATFLALALLASRHFTNWRARIVLFLMAAVLIGLVAFSRLYLGVHYPSDVLSGTLLEIAWILGLAAFFSHVAG
ncbi:MAG: phosphatase PAP2 family protein [Deltaproteobacteria bacterium]|nr:phosphatase PAP2 family protein [Deltaproteobacteria bacterium]